MSKPYRDLYHCMGHTHGTWLPGAPRGFRTRHHREHCEGDYKNPPPVGAFDELYARSKDLMKRDPVHLDPKQRKLALDSFVKSLLKRNIDLRVAAIDAVHFHILAAFPDHSPRHGIGIAKKESSHALKLQACGVDGGLWAVRCKCLPSRPRGTKLVPLKYIRKHAARGGVVYAPAPAPITLGSQGSNDLRDFDLHRNR